jgi:hypothetical protein
MLPNGEELPPSNCFLVDKEMFVKTECNISRTMYLQIVDLARSKGIEMVYLSVERSNPAITKILKTLLFLGFKQVKPQEQRSLCTSPAVLMWISIN